MIRVSRIDVFGPYLNVINNNRWGTPSSRNRVNPATEEKNPDVQVSRLEDVDAAVSAGNDAFKHWSQTLQPERRQRLMEFCDALENLSDQFAELLTKEQGKPVTI